MTISICGHISDSKLEPTMPAQTRIILVALIGIFLSSCAFTPHEVKLTPVVPITHSSVGEGVTVELQVFDERDDTVVGQRGAGTIGADITVADLIPTVRRQIKNGLETRGFRVVDAGQSADVDFEVKVRAFKYYVETGFWTGAENTSVVISVDAKKRGFDYDRTYRTGSEERIVVISEGATIDQKLNAALEKVLTQIVTDEDLIQFLLAT